jgi:mannan endo-1,4-beta-mannosidase
VARRRTSARTGEIPISTVVLLDDRQALANDGILENGAGAPHAQLTHPAQGRVPPLERGDAPNSHCLMLKRYSAVCAAAALLVSSAACGAVGFTVSGKSLRDANGSNFIPVGINNPHIWFDSQAYSALDNLAAKHANCIRIVWQRSGSATRLDQIISRCEALKMVPIVELHDGTGSDNPADVNTNAQWYVTNRSVFINHQRTVLINIINEWGNTASDTAWRDAYKTAITTLRNAGIVTTLVCDAPGWGQRASAPLTYGQDLLNYDPQHNLLFSVHMYGSWNNSADINTALSSFSSKNLPMVIGEFGWNHNNGSNNLGCRVDHRALMNYANQYGYGTIAWSTKGNDSANAWLDLTTDWNTPTSPWGNDVFYYTYGVYNRAQTASIFTSTSTGGTPVNGTYKIVNRNSGKAMDASGNGTADGTQIIQWTYGGGNNQRWTLTDRGSGQFSIIGVASGKALDVNAHGTANGTKVQLWTYSGGTNQKYTFTATSGGYYRVTPVHATSSCLEVAGSSTADGANVQLWSYLGGNNQQWSFSAP